MARRHPQRRSPPKKRCPLTDRLTIAERPGRTTGIVLGVIGIGSAVDASRASRARDRLSAGNRRTSLAARARSLGPLWHLGRLAVIGGCLAVLTGSMRARTSRPVDERHSERHGEGWQRRWWPLKRRAPKSRRLEGGRSLQLCTGPVGSALIAEVTQLLHCNPVHSSHEPETCGDG